MAHVLQTLSLIQIVFRPYVHKISWLRWAASVFHNSMADSGQKKRANSETWIFQGPIVGPGISRILNSTQLTTFWGDSFRSSWFLVAINGCLPRLWYLENVGFLQVHPLKMSTHSEQTMNLKILIHAEKISPKKDMNPSSNPFSGPRTCC